MIRSFNIKEPYDSVFEVLPNKSKILNAMIGFFLDNITEQDIEKLALFSHSEEKLKEILSEMLTSMPRSTSMPRTTSLPRDTSMPWSQRKGVSTEKPNTDQPSNKKDISTSKTADYSSWW